MASACATERTSPAAAESTSSRVPFQKPTCDGKMRGVLQQSMNEASGDAGSRVGGGADHGSGSRAACRSPAVARSGERCSLSPLRKLRSGGRQRQRSSRRRAQGKSRRGGRSGVSATGERRRCRTHSRRPAAAAARARARGPRGRGRLLLESKRETCGHTGVDDGFILPEGLGSTRGGRPPAAELFGSRGPQNISKAEHMGGVHAKASVDRTSAIDTCLRTAV